MIIPFSQYNSFVQEWHSNAEWQKHLRFGQAFYNWANLHKMTQTPWLGKLYNADHERALSMIHEVMDWEN